MEFDILDIDFDYLYDPFIRSFLLIDVLKNSDLTAHKQRENSKEYYIIHPVLKKLALLKKESILKDK